MRLSKSKEKHLLQAHFRVTNAKNAPSHLEQFVGNDSNLADEEFFFITNYVTSIDKLVFRDSGLTRQGLQLLKKIRHVKYLDLGGAPLDDHNLDCITHLSGLEFLYVKGANISAEGIYKLLKSFPALKTLIANIEGGGLRLEKAWQREFPDCELVLSTHS